MPGVNHPVNEQLPRLIADLHNRLRALETQQQQTITNANGQPVLNLGLVPGSNPARYGLQFVSPSTGSELMFIGEDSSGNVGLIGDSALTNPVSPLAWHADASGFTVPVATTTVATTTITVPSGFTQALVFVSAMVSAINTTAAQGTLYVQPAINGTTAPGWATEQSVPAGTTYAAAGTACAGVVLTGLGSSFSLQARAGVYPTAWAANPSNVANIDAVVLFLR